MSVPCDICGKAFDSKRAMYAHRRWHDLPEYKAMQKTIREKARRYMKGKHLSKETKQKLRQYRLGTKLSEETKQKIGQAHRGMKRSLEARKNISLGKKGKKFSKKHIENLSKAQKGKRKGSKNPNWKGDQIGYGGLHYRIKKNKPKTGFCDICGKKEDKYGNTTLEISNITGEYKNDIDDFQWAHRSCHRKYDYENNIRRNNI